MKLLKNTKMFKMVSKAALLLSCLTLAALSLKPAAAQVLAGGVPQLSAVSAPLDPAFATPQVSKGATPLVLTGGTLRYAYDSPVTVTSQQVSANTLSPFVLVKQWTINIPIPNPVRSPRLDFDASGSAPMRWLVTITDTSGRTVWSQEYGQFYTDWGFQQAGFFSVLGQGFTISLYFQSSSPNPTQMSNYKFEVYF